MKYKQPQKQLHVIERIRNVIILLTLIVVVIFLQQAQASECWRIKNEDQKQWCYAEFEGKRSCWRIRNKDTRNFCYSKFEGKSNCWRIKNPDTKLICEMQTGEFRTNGR